MIVIASCVPTIVEPAPPVEVNGDVWPARSGHWSLDDATVRVESLREAAYALVTSVERDVVFRVGAGPCVYAGRAFVVSVDAGRWRLRGTGPLWRV